MSIKVWVRFFIYKKDSKGKSKTFFIKGFTAFIGVLLVLALHSWAHAAPNLTSISPSSWPYDRNNLTVTVNANGDPFLSGAIVTFTCNSCTQPGISVVSTQFISPTQLQAVINIARDAELTSWQVDVFNPDGTKSNSLSFSVDERNLVVSAAAPMNVKPRLKGLQ